MLPNHRPLVVAEQFGVLESLLPGRIGRSVGFTDGIRRALGRDKDAASHFGEQVTELLGYFTGEQRPYAGVHAIPADGLRMSAFLLATGSGAGLAAELGLSLVIAAVRGEQAMLDAIGGHREHVRPSAFAPPPYVVVSPRWRWRRPPSGLGGCWFPRRGPAPTRGRTESSRHCCRPRKSWPSR
jgi:alkanesulfonate monooxygenase SsuD/methylene tetrahydromethanopterin reductase-like flavin-dependent oxidoreductase (luciferase family)